MSLLVPEVFFSVRDKFLLNMVTMLKQTRNASSKTSSMTMLLGPNSERHKPHLESGSPQGLVSPAVLQRELGLLQLKVDLLELVHVVSETEVTEIRSGLKLMFNRRHLILRSLVLGQWL